MQGMRKVLERRSLIACGAWCLALCHCGGTEFNVGPGSAGTGNDSGGTKAQGGAAGNSGSAATGGSSGAAGSSSGAGGSGGSVVPDCDCPAGEYCLKGSDDCLRCDDLSRLFFDEPVRLATVSDNGQGSRFPRTGATSTDLLYHFDGVGMRYTADSSTSAGSSVAMTQPKDSAPLLLREPLTTVQVNGLSQLNFLFDRSDMERRSLRIGSWNGGLEGSIAAPAPFESDGENFSIAVALHAEPSRARAFWMTSRDSSSGPALKPRLVTAPLEEGATASDVNLKVNVGGTQGCTPLDLSQLPSNSEPVDPDLTPWVTTDGTLLVFSTTRLEPGCTIGTQKKDIYTVLLQASSGEPPDPALPMNDVNSSEDDVDPSFSADFCDLYFASNREGKFAVYRAHRE